MKIIIEFTQEEAEYIYKMLKHNIMESDLTYTLFKKFRPHCK